MKFGSATSILLADMTFVGRTFVLFVRSAAQVDMWCGALHRVHVALPFFAHYRAVCTQLKQRKHLLVAFRFSILSFVSFCWQFWAQLSHTSQKVQKASGARLVGLLSLRNLVLTWKAVAVVKYVGAGEDSSRIFSALSSPYTSSLRYSISFVILLSGIPSLFA